MPTKKISLSLILILSVLTARAQNHESISINHGPWLTDMTCDAVTVVWTSSAPAMSWVEFREYSDESFYNAENPRAYDSRYGRRLCNETLHSVRLTGLKPGTKYQYRVFSQEVKGWSYADYVDFGNVASTAVYNAQPLEFTTFDPQDDSVRFFVLNDIHADVERLRNLCAGENFKDYDFVLLNGDMRSTIENEEQIFEGWLDACVDLFASEIPIVFVRGNHENRGAYADRLYRYFPRTDGSFYYTFDVGKVNFIALDCGEDKPDSDIEYAGIAEFDLYRRQEAAWLEGRIGDADGSMRRIALLHMPPTLDDWHGTKNIDELFLPLLNRCGLDLMLCGHMHCHAYASADGSHNFPILVNSNTNSLSVTVTSSGIDVKVKGLTKKDSKEYSFRN